MECGTDYNIYVDLGPQKYNLYISLCLPENGRVPVRAISIGKKSVGG
jgi:hypothetical protein